MCFSAMALFGIDSGGKTLREYVKSSDSRATNKGKTPADVLKRI